MSSSKPIAVVTGGAGFIGSHMVDLLVREGYRTHVIDNLVGGRLLNIEHHRGNPDVVFENRDIRALEPGDSLLSGAQYVFHFAGIGDIVPSIDRPVDYMSTNVQGTVRVLEAARHAGVRKLVYAASSSCYGLAEELPTTENALIQPQYPYALSKYQGEQAVLHWGQVYRLPVNSVRIFNAYGIRSKTSGAYGAVFGVFLAQKLAGKPLTIVGDGTQSRDFLYVTDIARAFYAAAGTERTGRIYNLGAGNPQSVNRLADLLGDPQVHIPKRPGEPDCTWADISRIQAELGWKPQVTFEDGVRTMLEHLDYWREAPVWDPTSIAEATKTWFEFLDPGRSEFPS
jgi:UDP-glucose 4-epimerase